MTTPSHQQGNPRRGARGGARSARSRGKETPDSQHKQPRPQAGNCKQQRRGRHQRLDPARKAQLLASFRDVDDETQNLSTRRQRVAKIIGSLEPSLQKAARDLFSVHRKDNPAAARSAPTPASARPGTATRTSTAASTGSKTPRPITSTPSAGVQLGSLPRPGPAAATFRPTSSSSPIQRELLGTPMSGRHAADFRCAPMHALNSSSRRSATPTSSASSSSSSASSSCASSASSRSALDSSSSWASSLAREFGLDASDCRYWTERAGADLREAVNELVAGFGDDKRGKATTFLSSLRRRGRRRARGRP